MSSTIVNINENLYLTFTKANRIHLELLSFIKNELNLKKNNEGKKFSFSQHIEIRKEEKNESHEKREQKSNDTYCNSDDDDSINEEESSSFMSCDEESVIDL